MKEVCIMDGSLKRSVLTDSDIGRYIKFRSITRWSDKPAVRKLKALRLYSGHVEVSYGGYSDFLVRLYEIEAIADKKGDL
jgi:hypothetical protein